MAKRQKYEVVPFDSGSGFFISGGMIEGTFINRKVDADLICEALNMMARLKLRRVQERVDLLKHDLEQLAKALVEGTETEY